MEYKIKKIDANYINDILILEENNTPDPKMYYRYDRSDLERLFYKDESAVVFGAFDKDKLIGWASYRKPWNETETEGIYEMSSLVVNKEYRRKYVGQKLFEVRLNELLSRKDVKTIFATCHPQNIPIIMLYLKNKFVIYDFKKDKYGPGADRVYLKHEIHN